MGYPIPANAFCKATKCPFLGWKPPGLPVTSSFPWQRRLLLRIKNHRSPVHITGLSLGSCHLLFKMEPVSNRVNCSRHPTSRQCLCPQSWVYYLIGTRSAYNLRITRPWCSYVRCPVKTHPLLAGLRVRTAGDPSSPSITPSSNQTHLPLAKALERGHTSDSLFLLLNLTHCSQKNDWLTAPPALEAQECVWLTAAAGVTSLACKPAAPHLIAFPLPRCPGPPVTATIPSSGHIAVQPPWKPICNRSSSYQRIMFLIQIVLFKFFTKAAVINRAGGWRGGGCSVKSCHSESTNIDSFPFHGF